jgi:hypothetical protein
VLWRQGGIAVEATPPNLRAAAATARKIQCQIEASKFDEGEFFPDEKNVFSPLLSDNMKSWLLGLRKAKSTLKAYHSAARFWAKALGDRDIRSIKVSDVEGAFRHAGSCKVCAKTERNYISVLSEVAPQIRTLG